MAIFEKDTSTTKEYIALLDKAGDNLLAFISPVKGVDPEELVTKLQDKGLNAEIRQSKAGIVDIEL
jgi:hypothetical protein